MIPTVEKKDNKFVFSTVLPILKKTVYFRKWTISDELEYTETEDQLEFLRKLIKDPDTILNYIEIVDFYWLLKEIRLESKLAEADFDWSCTNQECGLKGQVITSQFDFEDDIHIVEKKFDKIDITDKLTYIFKNLSYSENVEFTRENKEVRDLKNLTFLKIKKCLDKIIENGKIYQDITNEEKDIWFADRAAGEAEILFNNFKDTQNIIKLSKKVTCPSCMKEREILGGLDFLQL